MTPRVVPPPLFIVEVQALARTHHPLLMETSSRFSCTTLLHRARRGDSQAFSQLIASLRPRLERLVIAHVRNRQLEAEDILQESLVHAFDSIRTLRVVSSAGFLAWFAGIVRNRATVAWRRGRERVRPRTKTALPWTLQRGFEPELLDSAGHDFGAADRVAEPPAIVRDGLPVLTPDRRVAYLLKDGFSTTLGTLGLVLDRASAGGMRRSLREARSGLAPPGAVDPS